MWRSIALIIIIYSYSTSVGLGMQSAKLVYPENLAVDPAGNILVVDRYTYSVRKVDSNGSIKIFAGNGEMGYYGDGEPARMARLSSLSGIAATPSGEVLIADTENNRIRRVNKQGIITTVAGNGKRGYSGDGCPALEASLYRPAGVAIDREGNIYIADTGNYMVRKIDSSGIISTVAGNGKKAYSGDGGPAKDASLSYPVGIAIDSAGNLFIADTDNYCIRKVDQAGIISTVAGNREPTIIKKSIKSKKSTKSKMDANIIRLNSPKAVAVDGNGNIYIADTGNHRICKVDQKGIIKIFAGTGQKGYGGDDGAPAVAARLNQPSGLAIDQEGNLFIADTNNQRICKIDQRGIVTTIASNSY